MTIKFKTAEVHKHFGLLLDKKLDFSNHIDNKVNKCNEVIGIMKRLSLSISRGSLLTIYKTFVCPYLDYADEIIQCNTCLAIKGAIQGTNRDRIYAELGLQSLSTRIWYQKLHFFCFFFSPAYLTAYTNFASERSHNTRQSSRKHLEDPVCRTNF